MSLKKEHIPLFVLFFISLGARLFYTLKTSHFSSDQAYFELRHAEHITQNYLPIIFDGLSYGGNIITHTHVWHYLLAFFDLFLSQSVVYKIIPAILASTIVFIVYFFSKKITNSHSAALFSALLASFIPTVFAQTLNQISILALSIPLFLILLYSLIDIKEKKILFLVASIVLILLEPLNVLMFFTFLTFILLLITENIKIRQDEREAIALHLVIFILINLIFFKKLYLEQGLTAVWRNVPLELSTSLFQSFDLFATIGLIGVIPLTLGFIGFLIAPKRDRIITLLGSVLIADFTLLLLKLIEFEQGVMILAVIFCITGAIAIQRLMEYIRLTKIQSYTTIIMVIVILGTFFSIAYTTAQVSNEVINEGVLHGEVEALSWIAENTPEDSVVIGNIYEGNMIIYLAQRSNVADTQFINAENRVFDIETVFTTESLVKATLALKKYDVDYIYFSEKTKELYDVKNLIYTTDKNCFKEVYNNEDATVYQALC